MEDGGHVGVRGSMEVRDPGERPGMIVLGTETADGEIQDGIGRERRAEECSELGRSGYDNLTTAYNRRTVKPHGVRRGYCGTTAGVRVDVAKDAVFSYVHAAACLKSTACCIIRPRV